jgi:hypothetical protein
LEPRWRAAAGLDEALQALDENRFPAPLKFELIDVPVLTGAEAIEPIATVDELLDAVAHAVEEVDSADELERILDGISRLCGPRPDGFARRAAPVAQRLATHQEGSRGLLNHGLAPAALGELLLTWLRDAPAAARLDGSRSALGRFIDRRLKEVTARVLSRQPAPLLAAPTHRGGWIDAQAFVRRLAELESLGMSVGTCDLISGMLRLAPDRRDKALCEADQLQGVVGRVVQWALGGPDELVAAEGDSASLWLAAGRSRCPRGRLESLARVITGSNQPDGLSAAQYVWKPGSPQIERHWKPAGAVAISVQAEPPLEQALTAVLRPTVALHELTQIDPRLQFGAPWYYQWFRLVWPLNADSFLAAGIDVLADRVDSPASTWSPNYVFL